MIKGEVERIRKNRVILYRSYKKTEKLKERKMESLNEKCERGGRSGGRS